MSWKAVASEKQGIREKLIAAVQSQKTVENNEITKATASEIVKGIQEGTWNAKQVVSAFIGRAIMAHKELNCLTEILFDRALQEAEELDREYAKTRTLKGPLHGVPITIKDHFDIAGFDSSTGYTRWANNPAVEDAEVVSQMRAAGAIIIAKTNVPQTMLGFECNNPVWGRTTNPWSKDHTCGGSSGGEAAILASDGSVIGIGSDIGGSLRIPPHFCGIYSLKPTIRRVSSVGARSPAAGFLALTVAVGPMARSPGDLKLASKLLFGASKAETPQAYPPVPYREYQLEKKLKFGYYLSDSAVKASPACQRAVLETVAALRKEGHECIEFTPPDVPQVLGIFAGLTAADGYKTLCSHLGPDPQDKSLFLITLSPKLPSFLRWLAIKLVSLIKNDPVWADGLRQCRVRSTTEEWELVRRKDAYVKKFHKEVWDRYSFDCLIAPVQAGPALPHGSTATLSPMAIGTFLYNVVDSPVGIIPVTRVDPSRDAIDDKWLSGPGRGSIILEEDMFLRNKAPYNPEKMSGLPVGIQVIGRPWEDEKILEIMELVDRVLGPRGFGPGSWSPRKVE